MAETTDLTSKVRKGGGYVTCERSDDVPPGSIVREIQGRDTLRKVTPNSDRRVGWKEESVGGRMRVNMGDRLITRPRTGSE